jgi:hypothetical protein
MPASRPAVVTHPRLFDLTSAPDGLGRSPSSSLHCISHTLPCFCTSLHSAFTCPLFSHIFWPPLVSSHLYRIPSRHYLQSPRSHALVIIPSCTCTSPNASLSAVDSSASISVPNSITSRILCRSLEPHLTRAWTACLRRSPPRWRPRIAIEHEWDQPSAGSARPGEWLRTLAGRVARCPARTMIRRAVSRPSPREAASPPVCGSSST